MFNFISSLSPIELFFLIIGFIGQGLFASRFIVQWIYSEKIGKSSIPIIFWYLSIFGGLGLLTYAIFRKDPVIITGQLFGIIIYTRNLILIYNKNNLMKKIHNYIDGKISEGSSKKTSPVYDPSTGEQISEVILSNKNDFETALTSSLKSFNEWSNVTPLNRSRILSNYKNLLNNNKEELASLVSMEHGKTLEDAKGSVTRGIEVVEFACGIPHLLKGEFKENVGTDVDSWSIRQPLGV